MKQWPIGEQALFRTLASLTEDLIFVIDAQETVKYVNPSTARMFRATPGDMIGRRMRDLFPPDVHERHSRNVGQVLELGVTLTFEEWSSFPAGDLYLSTQLIPLKDTKGTVTSILGVCRDITEGRMNEEKVGHAKREWERALDSMSELVAIVDLRHRFVRVNKAMSDKLGVKPRDLVGKVCHETVHATGVPPAYCPLMKMKSDSREHTAEIPCDDALGGYTVTVSPLSDPDGRVIGCVHVARKADRTSDSGEERMSRERVLRCLRGADYIASTQDQTGAYTFYSARPGRGIEHADIVGKMPFDLFEPEIAGPMMERLKRVVAKGVEVTSITRYICDGEPFSFLDQTSPIRDKGGGVTGVATVSTRILESRFVSGTLKGLDGDPTFEFTRREIEVMKLICEGLTNRQISERLCISKKTVDTHRSRIMRKLDVHTTADLVKYALRFVL